ncbi:MAG: type II toxin-antitoxin system VapC family toxin [Rhodospirillaceae bacterium]|nr:type II toxin-antitoxin system VapC family toxin [Rhodospirillaceae bacterium]MYF86690.1 type II toxin-antitoxin system VapC family toxin [Rhodospirillaceae bacterium]MYH38279.1 type II toxin-antitoxin system VapC family toxin [Rhodospirillaceae bacterium]MYK58503.1 type II toxin-antitoxin system VapC family toxin [Rhodospirillaceae bacterium]
MIALDTNVLVRYLVNDEPDQAEAARTLIESLSADRPAYVCREVAVELCWVLERNYSFSRDRIATILEDIVATEELRVEEMEDVVRAANGYRRGGAGFSDRMIAAAARRSGADTLYTFDRQAARLIGAAPLPVARA